MEEKEKRPMVALDVDLHRALKMYAAGHDTNVKAIIDEAARAYLKAKGGQQT